MRLSNLAHVLRAAGLTVVETPGWATRGFNGRDLTEVRGILWHHTATNRARFVNSDAPTLQMCITGRPDVPGPLVQIVFGRNGTVYLAAAGLANHAGAGSAPGIPVNQGNYYLIGIEMESSGVAPWDWTPEQIRVAPHLGAALERAYLSHLPEAQRLQLGHQEYSSQGKIDPAGWPGGMNGLRAAINTVLAGGAPAPAAPAKVAPAAAPAPAPAAGPVIHNRTVTTQGTNVRTGPGTQFSLAPGYPSGLNRGAVIGVTGYVAGQAVTPGNNAWYKTRSGFYVWANNAGDNIAGLPFLR